MRILICFLFSCCLFCVLGINVSFGNQFFHGATIDAVSTQSIIIDEATIKRSTLLRCYAPNDAEIDCAWLAKGKKVDFELNKQGEVVSIRQYGPPRE